MFFPVLFATQKLSALLLMTFYVHEIAGTVSDGIPDQWPLILPRTAGLAIAALGLFRPKPGYARKNLNSFLLLSSLAATLLLLLNILVEALGMMQPFWGAPPEIQVAFAVGHFLISLPDLLLKIRRFSLRTLSLAVLALACCGTIIANRFYARMKWAEEEKPIVDYILSLKGLVVYENWRVAGVTFWDNGSYLTIKDYEKLSQLPNLRVLRFGEHGPLDADMDAISKIPGLKELRVGICTVLNPVSKARLNKARPDIKINR